MDMNIFVLSYDPCQAARWHCDKHIPKMCVELYQQLGSALRRYGATDKEMPLTKSGTPLKGGYHNHPCTKWVGDSLTNWEWAWHHARALFAEFHVRFHKRHFCEAGLQDLAKVERGLKIPKGELTPFALAMPDEHKTDDAVESYRSYYKTKTFAKWERGSKMPDWFVQ